MPPKIITKQKWSNELRPSLRALKELTTWILPFIFTAANQTSFNIKAGNKDYALDGFAGEGKSVITSELVLKKKYRLVLWKPIYRSLSIKPLSHQQMLRHNFVSVILHHYCIITFLLA